MLGELPDSLVLPRGTVEDFDTQIWVEGAEQADRVALVLGRALAGRPVDDATIARLVRDPGALSEEESSQLARAMVVLGRRDDARPLVRGQGPHAILAQRALSGGGRRATREIDEQARWLLRTAPPALGDLARPAWIAALPGPREDAEGTAEIRAGEVLLGTLDLEVGGVLTVPVPPDDERGTLALVSASVRALSDPGLGLDLDPGGAVSGLIFRSGLPASGGEAIATRLPLSIDGLPLRALTTTLDYEDRAAGCVECSFAPGDALRVDGDLSRASVPGGIERVPDPSTGGFLLRARVPGRYQLRGIGGLEHDRGLVLRVVQDELSDTTQDVALVVAREAVATDRDPTPALASRPRLEDWSAGRRAEVASLRYRHALRSGAPPRAVTTAFEDLRDIVPDSRLSFAEVLTTAEAYRSERPGRAQQIERAGIAAAFVDEVAIADRIDTVLGPLASIQVIHEVASRYPSLPVVQGALFELPARVLDIGSGGVLPPELRRVEVTLTDLRLMSAAWNREFVTLHPESGLVPVAGLRLVADLLHLGAWERAAGWGERLAGRFSEHHLQDNFTYLEGLAWSGADDVRRAAPLLRQVSRQDFPTPDGLEGPSELQADAGLALARLLEARGDREGAALAYDDAAGEFPEADASLVMLRNQALELGELLLLQPGDIASLNVTLAGVDRVQMRAYELDLRTLFLRDGGLEHVQQVGVAGISPAWSGERGVPDRPYPRERQFRLPLSGPGAWLVQLHAGGRSVSTLVVRSELELVTSDAGGLRRVTVSRRGRPAQGVQVRAVAGGEVIAAVTDVRGAAMLPAYAPALAFDGEHYAFSSPSGGGAAVPGFRGGDELMRRLDERLEQLRSEIWQPLGSVAGVGLSAESL